MSNLPVPQPRGKGPSPRHLAIAAKAQARAGMEIFDHHLHARVLAECTEIDIKAVSDVTRTAIDEEVSNLEWGLQRAGGSAAAAELVARKIGLQARLNDAAITRAFGS